MRIMIFGRSGSGKSTYALKLQQQLNIPLYHLDRYFFMDNWVERDESEFLAILQGLVEQKDWIIDGNCLQSLELRYKNADVCLYLNPPKWLCLWRVFKRRFNKDQNVKDRPPNSKEIIRWQFLRYIWNFDQRVAPIITHLKQAHPLVKFIEAKSTISPLLF